MLMPNFYKRAISSNFIFHQTKYHLHQYTFSWYLKDKNPVENCPIIGLFRSKVHQMIVKITIHIKAHVLQYCIVSLLIIFNWQKKGSLKYIFNAFISHSGPT